MLGAIFDMDGVLFPTEELKFLAYRKVFEDEFGVELTDTPQRLGLSETKAMELFLGLHNLKDGLERIPELIEKKRLTYYEILVREKFGPYEGAEDFLKQAKNSGKFKLGLATSSNRQSVDILFEKFDLRKYFDSVLTLEDIARPKPDPEIYLISARQLNIKPSGCIVFEDSNAGVEAAKRAGMKCIAVSNTAPKEQLAKADLIIAGFKNLTLFAVENELIK